MLVRSLPAPLSKLPGWVSEVVAAQLAGCLEEAGRQVVLEGSHSQSHSHS